MNDLLIYPPAAGTYPPTVGHYVEAVSGDDLLTLLETSREQLSSLLLGLSEEALAFRYAPGKWALKEMLGHMIDTERIFAYRALRFARQDATELPGFDENWFTDHAKAQRRDIRALVREYRAVREATLELFRSFDEEDLEQTGLASGHRISVRTLGYAIAGHERHHWTLINEKYLR